MLTLPACSRNRWHGPRRGGRWHAALIGHSTAAQRAGPLPVRVVPLVPMKDRYRRAMAVSATLETNRLAVTPGSEATLELRVRNTGTVVDVLTVEVVGDAAAWS